MNIKSSEFRPTMSIENFINYHDFISQDFRLESARSDVQSLMMSSVIINDLFHG